MLDRGGQILGSGTIGYAKPIRQQILMPGETLRCGLQGTVQMEALRERDALRINAHIAAFLTPIRWVEPNWTNYVREGRTGSTSISFVTPFNPGNFGIGGHNATSRPVQAFWRDAIFKVYNEWYKWPEDADATTGLSEDGLPAVNLEHSWTRCRDQRFPADTADQLVGSATNVDVTQLAETQAAFRSAIQKEVLSYGRYQEILKEMWGAKGSREVDQVPILLGQDSVGVNPRSLPATDSAGLGQWMSLYDFGIDFGFEVTAPEHCILTYMLTVRFAPITEEVHPLANDRLTYEEQVGDPTMLAALPPQEVQARDMLDVTTSNVFGYLPAGWQWRAGNNIIGKRIDERDSFPYMRMPANAAEARDATRRVEAFRSQALGDFRIDIYAKELSDSAMPNALSSHYLGVGDSGKGDKSPYPKQGKVK